MIKQVIGDNQHNYMRPPAPRRRPLPGKDMKLKLSKAGRFYTVAATRAGKQTCSEGQCRQWSAVYGSSGPKAVSS